MAWHLLKSANNCRMTSKLDIFFNKRKVISVFSYRVVYSLQTLILLHSCQYDSLNSVRMLKCNITTNNVSKFRILYTFEYCEWKYILKMIESVGSIFLTNGRSLVFFPTG